jgi:hypothetical protein
MQTVKIAHFQLQNEPKQATSSTNPERLSFAVKADVF